MATTPLSSPVRVLSLDGGGIRGLSSLLILERIMEDLRKSEGLPEVLRPCEHFDLIGGTSTGGIIAIMLGRLRMTVNDCIQAYKKVAQQAFTPKRTAKTIFPASPSGAFSATQLEAAIKQTIRDHCTNPQCVERRSKGTTTSETCPHEEAEFRDESCTKTAVLAITRNNVDVLPTIFKTYDTSESLSGCTIWQVARATSAATTFFKPIKVGRDEIEFIDAAFGYNNPCEVLITEAQKLFPDQGRICILSIGTGLGDVAEITDRMSVIKGLKKMAISSQTVASRLDGKYGDSGQYHRFNVEKGLKGVALSDWEKSSKISAHTRNYLEEGKTKGAIAKFVENSTQKPYAEAGKQAVEEFARTKPNSFHFIPFSQNKHFVGRGDVIDELKQKFFGHATQQVALLGLGGMGKTQVALHLAHWVRRNKPGYSVIWLPAFSIASFDQACTELAQQLDLQSMTGQMDARKAVRQYLTSEKAGQWLLIIDNLDDMEILKGSEGKGNGVLHFLPESENGRTLITTRSNEVAVAMNADDIVELLEMSDSEATKLLGQLLDSECQMKDEMAVFDLLRKLAKLPLAIAQAAAYMRSNRISIAEYLRIFDTTDQDAAELLSRELLDETHHRSHQGAVATTWIITFNKIRNTVPRAARLLSFITHIEPRAIPRSLLPEFETRQQVTEAIGTLLGYGLISQQQDGQTYDMHRLVYLATRIWLEKEGNDGMTQADAVLHIERVFPEVYWETRTVWRPFLPHALKALQTEWGGFEREGARLGVRVGQCLMTDGQMGEAVALLHKAVAMQETTSAEADLERLWAQNALAYAYGLNGQPEKAIELFERVVTVLLNSVDENHPELIQAQSSLASTYIDVGRTKDAVTLLEYVMPRADRSRTKKELGAQPWLDCSSKLGTAYLADGEVAKAIEVLEHAASIASETLSEDRPSMQQTLLSLAEAYRKDRQIQRALELMEYAVGVLEKSYPEGHIGRQASERLLRELRAECAGSDFT